jgi:hypothetical protein
LQLLRPPVLHFVRGTSTNQNLERTSTATMD